MASLKKTPIGNEMQKLSDEELKQVCGGAVGDTYTGWQCQKCGSSKTNVVCTEDYDADPDPDGAYYHISSFSVKCDACGARYDTSAGQLMEP